MSASKYILSDELIIGYIDGTLSDKQIEEVEQILSENEDAFSRYAILNLAYREIEQTKFEVTPDVLKERINKEFNIDLEEHSIVGFTDRLVRKIDNIIEIIFQPGPTIVTILSVLVIMVFMNLNIRTLVSSPEEGLSLSRPPQGMPDINDFFRMMNNKGIPVSPLSTEKNTEGIKAFVKNDTLVIDQLIGIERDLVIVNDDQTVWEEHTIVEKHNKIPVITHMGNDSIRLIIYTFGQLVSDQWIKIK